MHITKLILWIYLIGALLPAHGGDLLHIYQLALDNDPNYKQSLSTYQAISEQYPQALATLLPSVTISANSKYNDQDIHLRQQAATNTKYNEHGYTLQLRQPLFRWDRFVALKQADAMIMQAYADLLEAEQALILRVAESYFRVLGEQDNLTFVRAAKKSLAKQHEQASQRLQVGLGAVTDVEETKAGFDRSVADEIMAANNVENALQQLHEIIGQTPPPLFMLGENMPLVSPDPADIDAWVQTAVTRNMSIISNTHAVSAARQEIKRQTAGHYPTLDLVAMHNYNRSAGRFGEARIYTDQIGLELNVPIYQGGLVRSKVRESHATYNSTFLGLERARRSVQRATREAYLGVVSDISLIQALQQALTSSETALEATLSGFNVGTRTAVDVVVAEQLRSSARRDYALAKYNYLMHTLNLKQAAGILSITDIEYMNHWFQASSKAE